MRLHLLMIGVDLAAPRVLHPEGLDGGDDHAGVLGEVMGADHLEIRDVEHPHPAAEGRVQTAAIGVARVAQRLDRLGLDRVARDHPQHQRALGLKVFLRREPHRLGRQQRLAAAGGQDKQG